jgi:hypothetical protein
MIIYKFRAHVEWHDCSSHPTSSHDGHIGAMDYKYFRSDQMMRGGWMLSGVMYAQSFTKIVNCGRMGGADERTDIRRYLIMFWRGLSHTVPAVLCGLLQISYQLHENRFHDSESLHKLWTHTIALCRAMTKAVPINVTFHRRNQNVYCQTRGTLIPSHSHLMWISEEKCEPVLWCVATYCALRILTKPFASVSRERN